jgi:hypothetical protein
VSDEPRIEETDEVHIMEGDLSEEGSTYSWRTTGPDVRALGELPLSKIEMKSKLFTTIPGESGCCLWALSALPC